MEEGPGSWSDCPGLHGTGFPTGKSLKCAVGCNCRGCLEWGCWRVKETFLGSLLSVPGWGQVQVRGPREEHFGQKGPNMEADLKEAQPFGQGSA